VLLGLLQELPHALLERLARAAIDEAALKALASPLHGLAGPSHSVPLDSDAVVCLVDPAVQVLEIIQQREQLRLVEAGLMRRVVVQNFHEAPHLLDARVRLGHDVRLRAACRTRAVEAPVLVQCRLPLFSRLYGTVAHVSEWNIRMDGYAGE